MIISDSFTNSLFAHIEFNTSSKFPTNIYLKLADKENFWGAFFMGKEGFETLFLDQFENPLRTTNSKVKWMQAVRTILPW